MKIAIFMPSFLPKCSGAEIFHHNLATRFAEAGHEPVLVIPRRNVEALSATALPYARAPFPANLWSWFKRSPWLAFRASDWVLRSLQRRHRFDVWHGVVTFPTGVSLIHWQRGAGRVPCVVRAVGDDLVSAPEFGVGLRRNPVADRCVRRWLPRAQAVVALSEAMAEEYRALGVPAAAIHRIPNAVDLPRFSARPDRVAVREKFGVRREAFLFLSVGRNHPQKDFTTLLQAAAILKGETSQPWQLLIVGRDSEALSAEVREWSLGAEVSLGSVAMEPGSFQLPPSDLIELYRSADAFVMSSLLEGFSSALIEAMAAELPVIATDAPGCREFHRDALLVPTRSPAALAAAMRTVLEEEATRGALVAKSRARAAEFTWPRAVEAYLGLYRQLGAGAARP